MKAIIAITIIGIAAIVYAQEAEVAVPAEAFKPECPIVNGEEVKLIGNPENCTTYYACDNGNAVPMMCPPDLHFNDCEKACDWKDLACCDKDYDPKNKCEERDLTKCRQ